MLEFLIGIPRSGKSTYCTHLRLDSYHQPLVIEFDEIRKILHNGVYSQYGELITKSHGLLMAQIALKSGMHVVLDDTFTNPFNCQTVFKIDKGAKATWIPNFQTYLVGTLLDEHIDLCIQRAKKLNQEYLIKVIYKTAKQASILANTYGESLDELRNVI